MGELKPQGSVGTLIRNALDLNSYAAFTVDLMSTQCSDVNIFFLHLRRLL